MKTSVIRYVIILGLIAFIGILAFQVYWVMTNYQSQRERVQQQVQIVLMQVAQQLAAHNQRPLPQENLITQRAHNYFIVNINDEIDVGMLQQFLLTEMNRVGLYTDVEYAIYDCDEDKMAYGHYCDIDMLEENITPSELPKYDKYDYYFGVRFPGLREQVMSGLGMTLVLTGLLVMALLFIGWATYVIIVQKRLSDLTRDFINNMTHELKTPLSSIKIAGDTFMKDPHISSDDRLMRYATIVREQADHLNQHVEKILDIARLDKDMMKVKLEEVDLHGVIDEVHQSFELAHGTEVQLMLDLPDDPVVVQADELHATNVLYNLIDNAIKYGGHPPEVGIRAMTSTNQIKITVSDNGRGISAKNRARIFDKFYRVPTGDVHNIKGFGLGLYYVQQVTRLMGWDIELTSSGDQGSTFTLIIPKH